jgi:hypothetical protein
VKPSIAPRLLMLCAVAIPFTGALADMRLTHDVEGGYISTYTLGTGKPYSDATLTECSRSRGRQNEPAVAVNPRNTNVLVASSNDYCGVYNDGDDADGAPIPSGPVWLGYYRSENGGLSFRSSLVPGGNTLDDGKRFVGSVVVAKGSAAPNLLGKFHDKTAIEADRTGGRCDGVVYFAWARFTGVGISNIYLSRSVDHGATWSTPMNLTPRQANLQDPDISITGNGHVYVTYDVGALKNGQPDGVEIVKSTDCGRTFGGSALVVGYVPYEVQDRTDAGGSARDCGDFADHCQSGYTFFRGGTSTRSTADQYDGAHEWIYIVYAASRPGSEVDTGTTYGSIEPGRASQSVAYFLRYDGASGTHTPPHALDDQRVGHQLFPDISADGGVLHALWWDSRLDRCYSAARPVGNCADRSTVASLDVWATMSLDHGDTWALPARLTQVTSNPNYEQFDGRAVPFAGDYLWVTSFGSFAFGAWTDWRNTVPGVDQRETADDDNDSADVLQCRALLASGGFSGDRCPRDGGLDQDIYGAAAP